MQLLAALICYVNFLLNGFISTVKKTQKKKEKTLSLAALKNTGEKILPYFIMYSHSY